MSNMTRDESLTKLAMEVAPKDWWKGEIKRDEGFIFEWGEYMNRRTELINEPSDADAPEWAQWKAQDADGAWYWYSDQPERTRDGEWMGTFDNVRHASNGKIPAGHDWRTTLKEVNRVKREFNPTSSSLTDSQVREIAADSKTCNDGAPCSPNYCDGCPNTPEDESEWVLLDRRLNGRDAINPGHYKAGKVECIDALEAATVNKQGIEAVCTANAIKYLWRYESKGGLEDVRKARWYLDRLEQHLSD